MGCVLQQAFEGDVQSFYLGEVGRRPLQFKFRDFRYFPKEGLNRKLSVRVRNRSGPMTGDGIQNVLSEAVLASGRLNAMAPRVARRKPVSCCRFDGHQVKLIPACARTQQG